MYLVGLISSFQPLSTRSSPITIRQRRNTAESSKSAAEVSDLKSAPTPKHQTPPPSPLPRPIPVATNALPAAQRQHVSVSPKKLTASHSFRLPSPEPSVCSPRVADTATNRRNPEAQKPLNTRFNRLRVSHSLPDLSKQENLNEDAQISASTMKPVEPDEHPVEFENENKFVPIDRPPDETPDAADNILFIKPMLPLPIRSSNDEVIANMESLLETGVSINVDDIENESKENSVNGSKSSSIATEEEFWDSPTSTQQSMYRKLNQFDDLEMKRCKLENELGIQ